MNIPETNLEHNRLLTCFGNYVRKLRTEKGEKLYSVSSSLGITHPVISKIENGSYSSLSSKLMMKLLAYYNVGIVDLLAYLLEHLKADHETGEAPSMQDIMNDTAQLLARMQQVQQQTG